MYPSPYRKQADQDLHTCSYVREAPKETAGPHRRHDWASNYTTYYSYTSYTVKDLITLSKEEINEEKEGAV